MRTCNLAKLSLIQRLNIPDPVSTDCCMRAAFDFLVPWRAGFMAFRPQLGGGREDFENTLAQLHPDFRRDVADINRLWNMMNEVDQHCDGCEGKPQSHQYRKVGHKGSKRLAGFLSGGVSHCPEHHQAIDKRRDEGPKRHLIIPVAHEIADQTRTKICAGV